MIQNATVHQDSFNLLCDALIGYGISRQVFSSRLMPQSVVKVEQDAARFQNVMEYQIWQSVKETDFAKWFAPCEFISANGSVLVQARTEPVPRNQFPKQMPVFLTDFKRANYGLYDGRVVCHDYGTALLFEYGMSKRMKKAEWWDL